MVWLGSWSASTSYQESLECTRVLVKKRLDHLIEWCIGHLPAIPVPALSADRFPLPRYLPACFLHHSVHNGIQGALIPSSKDWFIVNFVLPYSTSYEKSYWGMEVSTKRASDPWKCARFASVGSTSQDDPILTPSRSSIPGDILIGGGKCTTADTSNSMASISARALLQ